MDTSRRCALPALASALCGQVAIACLTLGLSGLSQAPARAKGWSFPLPPDLVTPHAPRRNPVFSVGEPIRFTLDKPSATRYEVRDYFGALVASGAAPAAPPSGEGAPPLTLTLKPFPPGWYKLYLYGALNQEPWGKIVGGTTFVVFRRTPGFPAVPTDPVSGGTYPSMDEVMRGVTGMGPQRHAVADASKPDEAIAKLEADLALDRKYYLPFDPYRKRVLMVAFPNGTEDQAGVKKIVERFQNDVTYWEPRNEPNFKFKGDEFVEKEMKPFYQAVKSVNPRLKVLGPGTVTIGPNAHGLDWIEAFLKAGGARYVDAFSFHAYNTVNGDLWLARKALNSLNALLRKYGAGTLEKWQTEQGYFAAVYGSYQPRLQGRWTMLQMMVYEQYGIPKEHNHLWYDISHGFWDVPTWWENEDGSLNPAAPLMRVWSEELYGTGFAKAYDFGPQANRLYLGSLFTGPGKRVAAFMSAGDPQGAVALRVRGGSRLRLVSAFGRESVISVTKGRASLPVTELPVYVELAPGQTLEPIREDWGPNLAREAGVVVTASGSGKHPVDATIPNPIAKLTNGVLENWYWTQQKDAQPWMDDTKGFPAWVELRLPKPETVARVLVFAAPPWQWQGTLADYDLQVDQGGKWITLKHVQEPLNTFRVFTPPTRTTVDSFFSDRWVFPHPFPPVKTSRIRLLVHNTTYGGGATKAVDDAGGQTGPHQIMLREVEVYGK